MRISDWSSDVCSSDLSLPLAASHAALGILAGVLEARRSGVGARLEVSMADSAMWALSEEFALQANAPGPGWGTFAARNVYACDDGRQVTVAATEPRTWAALCEGLEAPDLAGQDRKSTRLNSSH